MRPFHWSWPRDSPEQARRAREITRLLQVPEAIGRALANRGMEPAAASDLANRSLRECTSTIGEPDGTDRAAAMLLNAARRGRVGILCDYDVDGAAAQAILVEALRAVSPPGREDPAVAVPERNTEGFGPNPRCLDALVRTGVSCVAVLDCGTAAGDLLDRYQASHGLTPLVVDHHPPHNTAPPTAGVVVNPWVTRRADPGEQGTLCTAALAWFLARAMLRQAGLSSAGTASLRKRITFYAALGTACDVMRLDVPFNRSLVQAGVRLLGEPQAVSPGLAALCEVAGLSNKRVADDLGWRIGPRLNAGSRMGASDLAARCLRERRPGAAQELARRLDHCNRERVLLGHQAQRELESSPAFPSFGEGPVNVYVAKEATPGTVGLVSSSLVKRFGWPAVVLAQPVDGVLVGSGRSSLGFDIGGAVAAACQNGILLSGGGHAAACGLKLDPNRLSDLQGFLAQRFSEHAAAAEQPPKPAHQIDAVLAVENLADGSMLALAESQRRLDPWGQGLPLPLFGIRNCSLLRSNRSQNGHLFLTLTTDMQRFRAVWWNPPSDWQERIRTDGSVGPVSRGPSTETAGDARFEIVGQVELDEWRDRRQGRFVVRDARASRS